IQDIPGFPTYAQYKRIEDAQLAHLSPSRRVKAVVPQIMFDRIWDVLTNPQTCTETAQFRFWARKKFTLGTPPSYYDEAPGTETVLLRDGKLVAVQEQLYQLLCFCHSKARHGGRDRTFVVIHQHYCFVPKRLVHQVVSHLCP
ncbi:hypothetical protein B0H10DRAFT_1624117, partial [Mycena sp. CBHHK59/15]